MRQMSSGGIFAYAQRVAAATVSTGGTTVTLADGNPAKAAINESAEEIRRLVPEHLTDVTGRPALFYFAPADAARVTNGDIILYAGERFRVSYKRGVNGGDKDDLFIVFGVAGAV